VQGDAVDQALAQVISAVAGIQRGLALEAGLFVRGGVAIGPAYVDNSLVYGSGLLDAHCREGEAHVPRVLLAGRAEDRAVHCARCSRQHSPLGGHVLRDEDGGLFVNYLESAWESGDERPNYDWLKRHRDLVSDALERHKRDRRVLLKYVWVGRYHNHICSQIPDAGALGFPELGNLRASRIE